MDAQQDFINSLTHEMADIIAIQEPYTDWGGKTRSNTNWYSIYPDEQFIDGANRTRSVMLVSRRLPAGSWKAIDMKSTDVTAMKLSTPDANITIINIYNVQGSDSSLDAISAYLRSVNNPHTDDSTPEYMIWLGDFNRHHPMWEEDRNDHLLTPHYLDEAEPLIELIAEHGMAQLLPKNTPTLRAMATGNHTRPDNVFATAEMQQMVIKCTTIPEEMPTKTDHFPITLSINMSPGYIELEQRPNYRACVWDEFRKTLEQNLENLPIQLPIANAQEFYRRLDSLTRAISDTVTECVPRTRPSPYAKAWWSKEIEEMRRTVRKLNRKAYKHRDNRLHHVHSEFKKKRNSYAALISKSKLQYWESFLEAVDENTVWAAHRFVSKPATDGGRTRIPTLAAKRGDGANITAETNEEKADMLFNTFFPPAAGLRHPIPENQRYPPPKFEFIHVTDEQIQRAIKKLSPYKAPGANGISNAVYTHCADILVPHLGPLFRATFDLNVYPSQWKDSTTLVLRKPGKPNYTVPGAYRPIALLDTMGKILSSCITEDIVQMAELHNLLPPTHFGCRPGRTTTDSLHYMTTMIKDAWRKGEVASVLYLDIKGAFPSVRLERLIHNMRMRGVPEEYTKWIHNKVIGREATLCFDDFTSTPRQLVRGIDQGCPISGIIFQFYNADLLEIPRWKKGEAATAFVDDAALIATGKNWDETHGKLKEMMEKHKGGLEWSQVQECEYALDKTVLVDFTRKTEENPENPPTRRPITRPPLTIGTQEITPQPTAKFLGVIMDQGLRFKEHTNMALRKGTNWLLQFKRLARPSRGVTAKFMRRYYLAVAAPKMLYAADVFLKPPGRKGKGSVGHIRKLARIQRLAALHITGAMNDTATDLIDAHANLLPFHLLVKKTIHRATIRLATIPARHPLYKKVKKAAKRYVGTHRTPLHENLHAFGIIPHKLETIQPVRFSPKWRSQVTTHIAESREAAIEEEREEMATVKVYSDGSCIDGYVGAAAVLYRDGRRKKSLRIRLGSERHHTVYEAELMAMDLGTELIRTEPRTQTATIGVDNQAAIRAIHLTKGRPGHYIVDGFHRGVEAVEKKHGGIAIRAAWVPGHEDIAGNEYADEQAKRAAGGDVSSQSRIPKRWRGRLPHSKSAAIQALHKELKEEAGKVTAESAKCKRFLELDPDFTGAKYLKNIAGLPRRHATVLLQLRSGHVPLNKHLHRINRAESPKCPACGERDETVHHFIMQCRKYNGQRHILEQKISRGAFNLQTLLANPKALPHLFQYINSTGRFASIHKDLALPFAGSQ